MAKLASMYWNQGQWLEAKELQVLLVMETTKWMVGEKYLDSLKSMANLVVMYWNQGQ